ncbi:hypothetical protein [Metaclostridioides mangenotii]|uniref:hypothetical protein n=1 Tax=Metaclostridioides mangenotii TaxID=1540 RepID=UPI0028E640A9|nr:hypothetical protein [Clostridioides mangenotii]
MEDFVAQFVNIGAVGIVAYVLFKNTLDEKKQDRDLYRESVETFTETSKQYAESIQTLSYRVENVEQGNGRIEQKLDKFIDKGGITNENSNYSRA